MYTYDYDFTYNPSMPVIEVVITPFEQSTTSFSLSAMLDSGADGTLIPLTVLQRIQARRTDRIAMRTITDTRSLVDVYEVTLRLGPHTFHKVRVVADRHNSIMILGRDILNHLVVTLNGLAATTELHE